MSNPRTTIAKECAEVFYQIKVPEGKWTSLPKNAKENYISAMEKVLKHLRENYDAGRI